jgi:beta-glucuronidase
MDFIAWNEYYETWYGGDPGRMRENLEAIHRAFPGKPVVISEYGYCACTADRPEDDARRAAILETHNTVFRDFPWVGGLIFFDYNDYRTHMGDKGAGVLRQQVTASSASSAPQARPSGVLRRESKPGQLLEIRPDGRTVAVTVRTRRDLPSYTLRGYRLRWTSFGHGNIPLARREAPLPDLGPGDVFKFRFAREDRGGPAEAGRDPGRGRLDRRASAPLRQRRSSLDRTAASSP